MDFGGPTRDGDANGRAGWIDRAMAAVQRGRAADSASGGVGGAAAVWVTQVLAGAEDAFQATAATAAAADAAAAAAGGMLDVVEGATAVLPRLAALALAPTTALANHSCLPNCQPEMSFDNTIASGGGGGSGGDSSGGSGGGGGSSCGALRVTLVALRDISPGEDLTVPYVQVTQSLGVRRADLAARHGGAMQVAACIDKD